MTDADRIQTERDWHDAMSPVVVETCAVCHRSVADCECAAEAMPGQALKPMRPCVSVATLSMAACTAFEARQSAFSQNINGLSVTASSPMSRHG